METNKITYALIDQYLKGKLDEQAMYELERQALDDPFLADALEGYSAQEVAGDHHLSILQRQLQERISLQQEKKNIFHFTWQRISVAATASLLFIVASILFWMKGSKQDAPLKNNERKIEVSLVSKDSIVEITSSDSKTSGPLGGWKMYNKYLQDSQKVSKPLDKDYKVLVAFTVDVNGGLSEFKIIGGATEALNREAIRLIKEGPKWKSGSNNRAKVSVEFKKQQQKL